MQLVFKVLRNGLLRYVLYTCPNLDTYLYAWVWRFHLPKNANFKVELAKICWPSSLPAVPKKEAANSTCRNTIAVKSTKHKLSLKTHGLLPTRDLVLGCLIISHGHNVRRTDFVKFWPPSVWWSPKLEDKLPVIFQDCIRRVFDEGKENLRSPLPLPISI